MVITLIKLNAIEDKCMFTVNVKKRTIFWGEINDYESFLNS